MWLAILWIMECGFASGLQDGDVQTTVHVDAWQSFLRGRVSQVPQP